MQPNNADLTSKQGWHQGPHGKSSRVSLSVVIERFVPAFMSIGVVRRPYGTGTNVSYAVVLVLRAVLEGSETQVSFFPLYFGVSISVCVINLTL